MYTYCKHYDACMYLHLTVIQSGITLYEKKMIEFPFDFFKITNYIYIRSYIGKTLSTVLDPLIPPPPPPPETKIDYCNIYCAITLECIP